MRLLDLAIKDLKQTVRDWKTAFFLLIMPILFTLLFGFLFSNMGGEEDPRLPVGFLSRDPGSVVSQRLLNLLDASDVIRPVPLEDVAEERAMEMVDQEDLAGVVIVPEGYGAGILQSELVEVITLVDPSTTTGTTAERGIQAAVTRLMGAVETAKLSAEVVTAQEGFIDAADRQAFLEETLTEAVAAWEQPAVRVVVTQSGAAEEDQAASPEDENPYSHSSPGMMVQFAIAGLIGSAEIIVAERKSKALRRLLTTAIPRTSIILGHYLAIFVLIFGQLVLLVGFGALVLGLDYLEAPWATLLVMATMATWVAALGLLIGVIAQSSEQAVIFSMIPMFVLSALGGAWMPLEGTSETFQTVGHLMPSAWAIEGFKNILIRGQGLTSALQPAAIMLGFAGLFFALAVWRFQVE